MANEGTPLLFGSDFECHQNKDALTVVSFVNGEDLPEDGYSCSDEDSGFWIRSPSTLDSDADASSSWSNSYDQIDDATNTNEDCILNCSFVSSSQGGLRLQHAYNKLNDFNKERIARLLTPYNVYVQTSPKPVWESFERYLKTVELRDRSAYLILQRYATSFPTVEQTIEYCLHLFKQQQQNGNGQLFLSTPDDGAFSCTSSRTGSSENVLYVPPAKHANKRQHCNLKVSYIIREAIARFPRKKKPPAAAARPTSCSSATATHESPESLVATINGQDVLLWDLQHICGLLNALLMLRQKRYQQIYITNVPWYLRPCWFIFFQLFDCRDRFVFCSKLPISNATSSHPHPSRNCRTGTTPKRQPPVTQAVPPTSNASSSECDGELKFFSNRRLKPTPDSFCPPRSVASFHSSKNVVSPATTPLGDISNSSAMKRPPRPPGVRVCLEY